MPWNIKINHCNKIKIFSKLKYPSLPINLFFKPDQDVSLSFSLHVVAGKSKAAIQYSGYTI